MAIDYRKEVDSGFDRKRIVEANVVAMLKEGIPIEIIKENPEFNPRHFEMVNNLERGYLTKEEQLMQMYGGYSKDLDEQIVPDRYSNVSHPIGGELYPMTEEETSEKFSLRDSYITEIKKLKRQEVESLAKEKEEVENALNSIKEQFPIIDSIIALCSELEKIGKRNENRTLNALEYTVLFRKYGLEPQKLGEYNQIYQQYQLLVMRLNDVNEKYELAKEGKVYSLGIEEQIYRKNELEAEIIQRNTKLVNWFIRARYGRILIDSEDLFQVCYTAMWEAVRDYDYRAKFKFSTVACKYMDIAVKHNFKRLTKYYWKDYWKKQKIETMLRTTSELVGHSVSIFELFKYGLISETEFYSLWPMGLIEEQSLSDMFPTDSKSYDAYEFESRYNLHYGDDEVDDFETDRVIQEVTPMDAYDKVELNEDSAGIFKILFESLGPNERAVIVARYGLDGDYPQSLSEIGTILNISMSQVRHIEAKSLVKMKNAVKVEQITDLLECFGLNKSSKKFR